MALGSTQSLTEMNTRNISWGVKAAGAQGWQTYYPHMLAYREVFEPQPAGIIMACPGL